MALHRQFDDALFALAVHAALLLGLAAIALGHTTIGPTNQFGQSGAHQWTSVYSVNNIAPLVAAATGFYTGLHSGVRAAAGGFVGAAAGYVLLFVGIDVFNGIFLDVTQNGLQPAVQIANATGVGATAALFAVVADRLG